VTRVVFRMAKDAAGPSRVTREPARHHNPSKLVCLRQKRRNTLGNTSFRNMLSSPHMATKMKRNPGKTRPGWERRTPLKAAIPPGLFLQDHVVSSVDVGMKLVYIGGVERGDVV
jgi:hypothetical protein